MKRLVVVLAACGSAPAATTEFFGQTIEPPRGLAWLRPGMSVAEAKALVRELHEPDHKGVREELVLDSGVGDVVLKVRIDAGTVTSIVATVTGHGARELLEQAWGPPQIARDVLGQPEVQWASESTGWKVKLDCGDRNCTIEYLPYHVLTAQFFGAHVVPPGELAKLRVHMKIAEARTIAPGPVSVRTGIATEIDGVKEYVAIDDKSGTLRSIYLNLPPRAEELIQQAWGEPSIVSEPSGKAVRVWPDPETGWRATLRDALGQSKDLVFENYQSAAQLFGDQPDSLDGLPEPVLGKTIDEVKRIYVDQVETTTGKDAVLVLPPTEWDRGTTRISLALANGKVRELSFSVPYKPHPPARDALRELFVHKWGDPKKLENNSQTLLFREDNPRVEIRDDEPHGAWHVSISKKS